MNSVTEPSVVRATQQRDVDEKPILICYDDSPDAIKAIEAAAGLFGPRRAVVVVVVPPFTLAEGLAATTSVMPGTAFEELNATEARRVADRGAEIARSSGFAAEPRGELASRTWKGIVNVADELDAAVIVIGSRGLSGPKEIVDKSLSHQVTQHAGRPVLIVPTGQGRQ